MKIKFLGYLVMGFFLLNFASPVKAVMQEIISFRGSSFLLRLHNSSNHDKPMGGIKICVNSDATCTETDYLYGEAGMMSLLGLSDNQNSKISIDIPEGYLFDKYTETSLWSNNFDVYLKQDPEATASPILPMPEFTIEDVNLLNPEVGDEFHINIHVNNIGAPFNIGTDYTLPIMKMSINYDRNIFQILGVDVDLDKYARTSFVANRLLDIWLRKMDNTSFEVDKDLFKVRVKVIKLPESDIARYPLIWNQVLLENGMDSVTKDGVINMRFRPDTGVEITPFEPIDPTPTPTPTPISFPIIRPRVL